MLSWLICRPRPPVSAGVAGPFSGIDDWPPQVRARPGPIPGLHRPSRERLRPTGEYAVMRTFITATLVCLSLAAVLSLQGHNAGGEARAVSGGTTVPAAHGEIVVAQFNPCPGGNCPR
jgi:hypothetical protein